jgi:hypothetical protein
VAVVGGIEDVGLDFVVVGGNIEDVRLEVDVIGCDVVGGVIVCVVGAVIQPVKTRASMINKEASKYFNLIRSIVVAGLSDVNGQDHLHIEYSPVIENPGKHFNYCFYNALFTHHSLCKV